MICRCENLPAGVTCQGPAQSFVIERVDRGEYRLVAADPPKNKGLVDALLSCPEKGWFVPIESESTDSLG